MTTKLEIQSVCMGNGDWGGAGFVIYPSLTWCLKQIATWVGDSSANTADIQ